MSERNLNRKRESRELEASSTSVTPLKKKKKLDDSSADSHAVVLTVPSPSEDSSQGRLSVTSDDDDKSSSISSGCFSSESNEAVRNNPSSVVDLEDTVSEALGETTETESSSAIKRDKPPEVSKIPTAEEIEEFLSELEGGDDKQKRFKEKYNFDIVNDKPLQGRYMWDRLNP